MASSWLSPSFWKRMATVPSWWLMEWERLGYELWIMGFMDHATVLICSFSKQSRLDNKNADLLAMRGFISLVVRKPRWSLWGDFFQSFASIYILCQKVPSSFFSQAWFLQDPTRKNNVANVGIMPQCYIK